MSLRRVSEVRGQDHWRASVGFIAASLADREGAVEAQQFDATGIVLELEHSLDRLVFRRVAGVGHAKAKHRAQSEREN